jgi:ABC-2 type transport system ATP-binding protein
LFDGELSTLVERFSAYKTIGVMLDSATLDVSTLDLSAYGDVTARESDRITLRVPKADTPRITAQLLHDLSVNDLTIESPPIEEVIERVFASSEPMLASPAASEAAP